MNKWHFTLIIFAVLVAIVLIYSIPGKSAIEEPIITIEGNLVFNSPGYKPDTWFLVYELPGAPALSKELKSEPNLLTGFVPGDRVSVSGIEIDGALAVTEISKVGSEQGTVIKLYFYNPRKDQGPGGAQCTRAGLESVERVIPKTKSPFADAIKLLLRGEISEGEKAEGKETEFPLEGVELEKALIKDGVAMLTFKDPKNKTQGGSCRVGILWMQIEATAMQFESVKEVRFTPESLFQP